MHRYLAFGLSIQSELEFPELVVSSHPPQVSIAVRRLPPKYRQIIPHGSAWYGDDECFLLVLEKIGRFLVQDGQKIFIDPSPQSRVEQLRVFLLGSCMGALLHQRGLLPLHASAIATEKGCVLFAGDKEAGKSTLAAVFTQRGYKLIADDICAIAIDANGLSFVQPSYPQLKIDRDWKNNLGFSQYSHLASPWFQNKIRIPVHQVFASNGVSIHRIYHLIDSFVEGAEITPLSGKDAFLAIAQNTYRREFAPRFGKVQEHFQLCKCVTNTVVSKRCKRKKSLSSLKTLADLLESDFCSD